MMRLVIHDCINPDVDIQLNQKNLKIISKDKPINHCVGCFGCWIKTPGVCVIKDSYQDTAIQVGKCTELILISRCVYGGQSSFVKKALDRSIGYMLPFFKMVNGEMHHKSRYKHQLVYKVLFYGDDILKEEKETATKLVKAQAINLHAKSHEVRFYNTIEELVEKLS